MAEALEALEQYAGTYLSGRAITEDGEVSLICLKGLVQEPKPRFETCLRAAALIV
jgi:hypothetical protein